MDTLPHGVNEARATLKSVGAEEELFNDVSVIAQLVAKLSGSHQDRWHQDKTSTDFMKDQRKTGEKFLGGEGKGKLWGIARDQRASLEQEVAGNAFTA